jgi:hypothetical protein
VGENIRASNRVIEEVTISTADHIGRRKADEGTVIRPGHPVILPPSPATASLLQLMPLLFVWWA